MLSEQQLRDMVGDEAFDAIPNHKPSEPKPPRAPWPRSTRNQARQRIVLSGYVPAKIAAGFTTAETAVLSVLAVEHKRRKFCDLSIGEIAQRAKCGRTVVQNTIAWAERWEIISVERRKIAFNRNLPNVIAIISPLWLSWLRLGPAQPRPWAGGGGFIPATRIPLQKTERKKEAHWNGLETAFGAIIRGGVGTGPIPIARTSGQMRASGGPFNGSR